MKTPHTASSATDCREQPLLFQDLGSRKVLADFSGGTLSSDGGVLLVRQVDAGLGLTASLAQCFCDRRQSVFVDHSVRQLLAQRIYGLALGYEDLNDHEWLRCDPLLATACEKRDPTGQDRFNPAHRGAAWAGASTLNRLELSNNQHTRAHKLEHDPGRVEACLLQMGVRCLPKHATKIVLDLDAMSHRLHGMQEGRHYRAHYDQYCYLPLYVFVGDYPLRAQLRTSDQDGSRRSGGCPGADRPAIRQRCRRARIIVRGDSGFCRQEIMAWGESQAEVYYCLGFARIGLALPPPGSMKSSTVRAARWKMDLRADRMSTHYLASNQLRLWLAAFAYLLLERLRTLGLAGTELAQATVGTVRLRMLKVAAQVRVSVRLSVCATE